MTVRGAVRSPEGGAADSPAVRARPFRALADRLRIGVAAVLLAVNLAVVLLTTLTPSPVDKPFAGSLRRFILELHERGVPAWIGYPQVEFTSNVLMFVPLGFLAALALPRRDWWLVAVLAPALSALLEAAQALFLPARVASAGDVIANGLGAAIGAALSLLARMLVHRRDQLLAADIAAGRRRISDSRFP